MIKLKSRHLQIVFTEESDDVGLHVAEKVYDVLQEVKTLDEECHIKDRLDKVDEFVMDAHILSSASDVVIKCVSALQLSVSSYDPTEFANKLVCIVFCHSVM